MRQFKVVVVILILLIIVILAVQNFHALSTRIEFGVDLGFFKAGSFQPPPEEGVKSSGLPVFLIAIIAFLVGVVAVWLYGIVERLNLKREIKSLTRDVGEKEKELNSLRNLPVTTEDIGSEQPSDIR